MTQDPTQITGIPLEYLFVVIGALVSVLYWDLRRALRQLMSKGIRRDVLLARICEKLGIPWNGNGD